MFILTYEIFYFLIINMTTYGNNFVSDNIVCQSLESTDVIKWNSFDPPLVVDGVPALGAVLASSGDAGTLPITDLGKLSFQKAAGDTSSAIEGEADPKTKCTNLDMSDQSNYLGNRRLPDIYGLTMKQDVNVGATPSYITGAANPKTRCTNLDLTDSSNAFPVSAQGDLAQTLVLGNNAGANGIDMNNQAISNALSVGAVAVQATQAFFTALGAHALSITGTEDQVTTGILNMNATTGGKVKLDFTGVTGQAQDTEIEGDDTLLNGAPKRTKCTYLDMSDPTNLLPANTNELYEWGAHWVNPISLGKGIQRNYVFFGSNTDLSPQGWRFVQAMSNGSDDFNEDIYHYAAGNKPFYARTASTTIPSHSSQIIEFTYPVTKFGDGRIFWGLYYSEDSDTATKQFLPFSGRMFLNNITGGGLQAADIRMGGYLTMKWVMKDAFPTDGTVWRIYPVFRTDTDQVNTKGHFECYIGNGVPTDPLLTWATGESLANGNGMRQQVFMRGYPFPATWTEFAGF
jgi:hypothetical protein